MNVRRLSLGVMMVAMAFYVGSAQAAAKKKAMAGSVVSISAAAKAVEAAPASGSKPAVTAAAAAAGKIVVADKKGEEKSYDLADEVSVVVNGEPGKLSDINAKDKIHFMLNDDGKVARIMKGKKAPK